MTNAFVDLVQSLLIGAIGLGFIIHMLNGRHR
jgi:hypothetical protein